MPFLPFVYGFPSSCPRAHCTPNKSVPTLHYTRKHGPICTGLACRLLPSAVPWISEDRLFRLTGPFTVTVSKILSLLLTALVLANTVFCVGSGNKQVTLFMVISDLNGFPW